MSNEEARQIKLNEDFERATYNGVSIIRHIKTGYVNATKICSDNKRRFKNLTDTDRWHSIINIYDEEISLGEKTPDAKLWFVNRDCNEIRGSYIHPRLVNHVAEWANLRYVVKVQVIMDAINVNNFEKLNKEISELKGKIKELTTTAHNNDVRTDINNKKVRIIKIKDEESKIEKN
jgi:hypothetical protein